MPTIPLPLGLKMGEGHSRAQNSENLINMYPEAARGDAVGPVALHGGPGATLFATIGGGYVRGQRQVQGKNFVVVGTTLYQVFSDGTSSSIGTINGSEAVDMTGGNNALVVVADAESYTYNIQSGVFDQIIDPDFSAASSCAFLNQRIIYTRSNSGRFFWSDINTEGDIDPLSFSTAESDTDNLVAVRQSNQELVLFGTNSVEFWRDTGDADNPFQRSTASAPMEVGCISRDSIALVNNGLVWLGRDKNSGGVTVFKANGYVPERIATHAVEHQLENAPDFTTARAISYAFNGHLFYHLTIPDYITLVYDFTTNEWHQRIAGSWPVGVQPHSDDGLRTFAMLGERRIVGRNDGNLYELSNDLYTYGSEPLVRELTTPPMLADGRFSFVSNVELFVESGVGLTTGQGSDPQVMLSVSKDLGRTWSEPRPETLGKKGEYKRRVQWNRLGASRGWMFKFRVSDPVKWTVMGGSVTYEQGTS